MAAAGSEFVLKLFRILEEAENYPYISWSRDGRSFVISNQEGFSEFVLERHFRHRNWSSFVRQLNKYDFCKVKTEGRCFEYDAMCEYRNRHFQRSRPDLLGKIRRKKAPSERSADPQLRKIETNIVFQAHVLNAVKEISKYLQAVTDDINEIKRFIHQERRRESEIRILLVHERAADLQHILAVLSMEGCVVRTVEDGEGAKGVPVLPGWQDLIVLHATSCHYRAAVNKIRGCDVSTPVILIVDAGLRDKHEGPDLGVNSILLMPFPDAELVQLVDRYRTMIQDAENVKQIKLFN